MTKRQLDLVQHSWQVLQPKMVKLGHSFYRELYKTFPHITKLMLPATGMRPHRLVYYFCSVTSQLNNLDAVTEEVRELSLFHQRCGMPASVYISIGQCLLTTWKKQCVKDWDEEQGEAWMAGYTLLAHTIIALQTPVEEED